MPEPTAPVLSDWIGRTETRTDLITPSPLARLSATLDRDDPAPQAGDAIPPLAHWLFFLPMARQSDMAEDGHPRKGGFLPPVPLPRRMWAGGRIEFRRPLRIGDTVERVSRVASVEERHGRSGPLCFVTVRHELSGPQGLAVVEDHDIVYRERPRPDEPPPQPRPAPADAAWSRSVVPHPVLMFRFSALTFNAHRIHYDRAYAMGEEGYPGLVVHGPLIATLLADHLRRHMPAAQVASFRYRALAPLFDRAPFTVNGGPQAGGGVKLWAATPEGGLAMEAEVGIV